MSRFLKIGVLLLCTAVFCWGMQYKLSLYELAPSAQVPAAKMLTGKAVASLDTPEIRSSVQPAHLAIFLPIFVKGFSLSDAGLSFIRSAPQRTHGTGSLTRRTLVRFAFRPPPSRA